MPTWGQTNTTNATNSTAFSSTFRLMGGTSPNVAGMTLSSVSLDLSGTGQTVRIAVYTSASLTTPVGATLIEDLGTLVINGSRQFWTKASTTNPLLPQNAPLWIAVKQTSPAATGYWSTSSADAGDFQTAQGRANITGMTGGNDPTVAFPSTLDGTNAYSNAWYAWYLTYTASGGSSTSGGGFSGTSLNSFDNFYMPIVIPQNTATATLRRIPFVLVDATDFATPEDITVTGVKASLSFNGGAVANSTNDIVKVDGATGRYYLELTQAEANSALGTVHGTLQPTGCARTYLAAIIGPSTSMTEALTEPLDANLLQINNIPIVGNGTSQKFGV